MRIRDFLENASKNSLGIDINPYNVEHCIKRNLNAKLIVDNKFPVLDKSFDNIILDQVLEHIENPTSIINEIKRTLNPLGKLIIGLPCIKGYKRDPDHKVFYNQERIFLLLKNMIST